MIFSFSFISLILLSLLRLMSHIKRRRRNVLKKLLKCWERKRLALSQRERKLYFMAKHQLLMVISTGFEQIDTSSDFGCFDEIWKDRPTRRRRYQGATVTRDCRRRFKFRRVGKDIFWFWWFIFLLDRLPISSSLALVVELMSLHCPPSTKRN